MEPKIDFFMDVLKHFFESIITLTFWKRLFSWSTIKRQSYAALEELQKIKEQLYSQEQNRLRMQGEIADLLKDIQRIEEVKKQIESSSQDLKTDTAVLKEKLQTSEDENRELRRQVQEYENTEEQRLSKHETELDKMIQSRESFETDRQKLADERVAEQEAKFAAMKKQWSEHETAVEANIKNICEKQQIEYVDKVPFKGNPDNTVLVCGEYVVFDAKSPANDNYSNFPSYLRSQAEGAKKYVKQENVRKEVYLVVPSSTVEVIEQWTYYLGDYTVYVITRDALEPVLLALKRLEDYEFADKLSPEDRETIVRIIAKFAHNTKRRIQIDQFFADQFLELLQRAERELPEDMKEDVVEFEKRELVNPPQARRHKVISTKQLSDIHKQTNAEAQVKKVEIPESAEDAREVL